MSARCEENENIARYRPVGLSHRQPDDPEQSEDFSSQWRLLQRTMDSQIEGCHEQPFGIPSFRQWVWRQTAAGINAPEGKKPN